MRDELKALIDKHGLTLVAETIGVAERTVRIAASSDQRLISRTKLNRALYKLNEVK